MSAGTGSKAFSIDVSNRPSANDVAHRMALSTRKGVEPLFPWVVKVPAFDRSHPAVNRNNAEARSGRESSSV